MLKNLSHTASFLSIIQSLKPTAQLINVYRNTADIFKLDSAKTKIIFPKLKGSFCYNRVSLTDKIESCACR